MKVRTRPLLVAAALLAGALVPLAAPAAADTGPVPLGMSTFGDIVVDEAHGQVFLSGGPTGAGVTVTDLDGAVVATLAFPGATGMALSPDGSRLWMAQPDVRAGEHRPGDARSRRSGGRSTGCPGDVAVVGDRLVYGYSCNRYLARPAGGTAASAWSTRRPGRPTGR